MMRPSCDPQGNQQESEKERQITRKTDRKEKRATNQALDGAREMVDGGGAAGCARSPYAGVYADF
jgi:hypothetical protein